MGFACISYSGSCGRDSLSNFLQSSLPRSHSSSLPCPASAGRWRSCKPASATDVRLRSAKSLHFLTGRKDPTARRSSLDRGLRRGRLRQGSGSETRGQRRPSGVEECVGGGLDTFRTPPTSFFCAVCLDLAMIRGLLPSLSTRPSPTRSPETKRAPVAPSLFTQGSCAGSLVLAHLLLRWLT